MRLFRSMVIAFSMYSRLPVPQLEWREEDMRYVMCFFPLIGGIIGLALAGAYGLCRWLSFDSTMFAVLAVVLPIGISGGIHLDGFLDTSDALSSWQTKEKRLEILKDSHIGAFAVIRTASLLLLAVGVWSQVDSWQLVWQCSLGFVVSRAASAWALCSWKAARKDGLLVSFQGPAQKQAVRMTVLVWLLISLAAALFLQPVCAVAAFAAAGWSFFYYKRVSTRQFGGITGDLAGWFVELCELAWPAAVLLTEHLVSG